jgi:hypothetical protein
MRATCCELICFARKRNLDARLRQNNTTGKSLKTCPAVRVKIFCFRSPANQSHNSARLTAEEGRWPSSRTCGEMRWTRELRLTCVAQAYGEVVWACSQGIFSLKFGRIFRDLEKREPQRYGWGSKVGPNSKGRASRTGMDADGAIWAQLGGG